MTGSIGLAPTLAALDAGRVLALANKESLIVGGPLVLAKVGADREARIVPVDSEHSALAQCLRGGRRSEVRRLVLTASGGPFRGRAAAELASVTPEQALDHPTWSMGPGRHRQLLDAGEQGPRDDRGAPALRPRLGRPRRGGAPAVGGPLHGGVRTTARRWPRSARRTCGCRSRSGWRWPDRVPHAAPGNDWTVPATWTFEPLDHAAFPAVQLAPGGRRGRRDRPGGVQRRERGGGGGVPRRAAALPGDRRHGGGRRGRARHRTLGNALVPCRCSRCRDLGARACPGTDRRREAAR